ncbi:putative beta-1,4-xylosyltransferase IRX9 [Canna indica]|uniref:Glycosyltransferases n=1 Tax=Canna indica TaxID=4628 RepID=A0AAQ3L180_9LILI|nr:putative beta-1,4-xylosyltransferase IRX9 [Canna indica]
MGSIDRSKKRIHLFKKAFVHFALCFVMGFFTGFAPSSTATLFSGPRAGKQPVNGIGAVVHPSPVKAVERAGQSLNMSLAKMPRLVASDDVPEGGGGDDPPPSMELARGREPLAPSSRLLIIVTTTRSSDRFQGAFLRRLAHTLRLVPPPLMWIVVQAHDDAPATAAMLRNTGVMYRHLTFKENFTDPAAEADHQRNVALSHVESHRLAGIITFAGASNVYDLQFFSEIREIEAFGTWPVAMVSTNRKRVMVDGPICHSSKIKGWILKDVGDGKSSLLTGTDMNPKPSKINISGFAFNSSILWDPERWGRPTSLPDTSQDSIKFVHEIILEDKTKLKGIPADCSRIMVWHLYIPRAIPLPFHHQNQGKT